MIASASSPVSTQSVRDERRMVSLDVGEYHLALDAEDLIGVRDDGQIEELAVLGNAGDARSAKVVRCPEGDIRAIDLMELLAQKSTLQKSPLVLVRAHTHHPTDRPLGLFVEETSRPRSISGMDWHQLPRWVRNRISLPAQSFVVERDRAGTATSIRLVLDPERFQQANQSVNDSANQSDTQSVAQGLNADSSAAVSKSGRGLLVFAPAESSQGQMKTALAVPMSFLMGVELQSNIFRLPTHDPFMVGVTLWNQLPIPVVRLGDALGLTPDVNRSTKSTRDGQSMRLLILRTPCNRVFGCMAHAQMRSLRSSSTKAGQPDCDIAKECLLGSFLTDEGPLSIPDLDFLLQSRR